MPDAVRAFVRRLVADSRPEPPNSDERLNGYLLTGGPSFCSFLDADGHVWNWSVWDETIEPVPDGPLKVGLVAVAAEREPALAAWLPVRPPDAADCLPCRGSGWLALSRVRLQCPECNGMGWVA
jgi:hypothetical protein